MCVVTFAPDSPLADLTRAIVLKDLEQFIVPALHAVSDRPAGEKSEL